MSLAVIKTSAERQLLSDDDALSVINKFAVYLLFLERKSSSVCANKSEVAVGSRFRGRSDRVAVVIPFVCSGCMKF